MWSSIQTIATSGAWAVLGSVVGFLIAQSLSLYQFSVNQKQTNRIEQIHLLRDLASQYRGKEADPVFENIQTAIVSCATLYSPNLAHSCATPPTGKFSYYEINRYLGFFEDVGFYESQSAITMAMVDQDFGKVIIEAYEYPELRAYVNCLQLREPGDFNNFQKVAKELEDLPKNQEFTNSVRNSCGNRR